MALIQRIDSFTLSKAIAMRPYKIMSRWRSFCCCTRVTIVLQSGWLRQSPVRLAPKPNRISMTSSLRLGAEADQCLFAWMGVLLEKAPTSRGGTTRIIERFKSLNLSEVDVKFVLVINGHQEGWLPPLQEALRNALRSTVKCWAFSPTAVVVINEALAQQYGLIPPAQGGGN